MTKLQRLDQWIFNKIEKLVLGKLGKKEFEGKHKYNLLRSYFDWYLSAFVFLIFLAYPVVLKIADPAATVGIYIFHFVTWTPVTILVSYSRYNSLKKKTEQHEVLWPLRVFPEVQELMASHCQFWFKIMKPLRIGSLCVDIFFLIPLTLFFLFYPSWTAKLFLLYFVNEIFYHLLEQHVEHVNDFKRSGTKETVKVTAKMTDLQMARWQNSINTSGC